jgi:hypothetical protein
MKKTVSVFLFLAAMIAVNAQTYKIQKAWAFVTESMPGRVMADEHGHTITPQPKIERFIYIETNYRNQPKIDSVIYNTAVYKATLTAVKQTKHQAGIIFADGKAVYINVKKGNKLWRIDVEALKETPLPGGAVKKITLKGKLGATSFKQVLYSETRLAGPEYQ